MDINEKIQLPESKMVLPEKTGRNCDPGLTEESDSVESRQVRLRQERQEVVLTGELNITLG